MKKILTAIVILVATTVLALAATPTQYNPNAINLIGTDSITGNGAAVAVDGGSGGLTVNTSGRTPTYHAVIADLAPAASATDVTTICGSATKTVEVTKLNVTADATAAGVIDFYAFIRSAADTGGTSAVVAASSLDSNNAAPTATVTKWTANPASVGTGVLFEADLFALPAASTTGYPFTPWDLPVGVRNSQPIILRGVNQCFAFGFNGQTIPAGMKMYATFEWTEDNR